MEMPRPTGATRTSRAQGVVLAYAGLTFLALVWGASRGQINLYRYPGAPEGRAAAWWLVSPLAGLALGLLVAFWSRFSVHRFQWARFMHQEFRSLLGPLGAGERVAIAAASAIGEECFFRGAMQPSFGLVACSAVFALLHIGPGWSYVPWTITAFALGLVMGGMYRMLGDLGGPIVAHFTINFLNLRLITQHDLR